MFFNKKYIKVNHNENEKHSRRAKAGRRQTTVPVVNRPLPVENLQKMDKQRVIKNKYVCYAADIISVSAPKTVSYVADAGAFETWDNDLKQLKIR